MELVVKVDDFLQNLWDLVQFLYRIDNFVLFFRIVAGQRKEIIVLYLKRVKDFINNELRVEIDPEKVGIIEFFLPQKLGLELRGLQFLEKFNKFNNFMRLMDS